MIINININTQKPMPKVPFLCRACLGTCDKLYVCSRAVGALPLWLQLDPDKRWAEPNRIDRWKGAYPMGNEPNISFGLEELVFMHKSPLSKAELD